MRLTFDPEADPAYLYLTDEVLPPGRDSVSCTRPGGDESVDMVLDWQDGRLVGLEVLSATTLLPADLLAQAMGPPIP